MFVDTTMLIVIHMYEVAVCAHLLQLLIDCIWLFLYLLSIAIFFHALSLYNGFVLYVENIAHVLDLESVQFQTCIPYNFMHCITLDMFCTQLIVLFVDSWNVNRISYHIISITNQ